MRPTSFSSGAPAPSLVLSILPSSTPLLDLVTHQDNLGRCRDDHYSTGSVCRASPVKLGHFPYRTRVFFASARTLRSFTPRHTPLLQCSAAQHLLATRQRSLPRLFLTVTEEGGQQEAVSAMERRRGVCGTSLVLQQRRASWTGSMRWSSVSTPEAEVLEQWTKRHSSASPTSCPLPRRRISHTL
jgi:hypothetical protein